MERPGREEGAGQFPMVARMEPAAIGEERIADDGSDPARAVLPGLSGKESGGARTDDPAAQEPVQDLPNIVGLCHVRSIPFAVARRGSVQGGSIHGALPPERERAPFAGEDARRRPGRAVGHAVPRQIPLEDGVGGSGHEIQEGHRHRVVREARSKLGRAHGSTGDTLALQDKNPPVPREERCANKRIDS